MKKHWTNIVCAAFFCASQALAAPPSDSERQMTGSWYGEFLPAPGKPLQRFLTHRAADGSFTLHARQYQDGKVVADLRNKGLWGISNGMYFTITTEVNDRATNPASPDVTNAYLVESLGEGKFQYLHVASGNRFVVQRVDANGARLPD